MQNRFIVRERKDARPQMDATAYGVDTVVERKRHRVQNRIQRNGDEQNQEMVLQVTKTLSMVDDLISCVPSP